MCIRDSRMGILLKKLRVPVISIHTEGAFARDPLYNCLQKRKVKVSANVSCLFTADEIAEKSVDELDEALRAAFDFDNFAWQEQNHIVINENFRADGLNRILYKCAHCGAEGQMEGSGTHLVCHACGKSYELTPFGSLAAENGETENVRVYTRSGKVYEGTLQLCNASVHVNGEYAKTNRTFDTTEILLDENVSSAEETRARFTW